MRNPFPFPLLRASLVALAGVAAFASANSVAGQGALPPPNAPLLNVSWPLAYNLAPSLVGSGSTASTVFQEEIQHPGESRWFKFSVPAGSQVQVALTHLPASYDLVIYSDISQAYNRLVGLTGTGSTTAQNALALLGSSFSPEAYSPEAYSPEAYSPEAYSPEAYSPEAYSPEAYSPALFSPEAYSPEAYSPEAYSPEAYSPEAYSPEAYSPLAYSANAYAAAQQDSRVGFSANPGTSGQGVQFNTFDQGGEFYIRVRGQNGVFSLSAPFTLTVAMTNVGGLLTNLNTTPSSGVPAIPGAPTSLIVWNSSRIAGTAADLAALTASISRFAAAANAVAVDVSKDAQISALYAQEDAFPNAPAAANLVANTIRNLIGLYRQAAPSIADITLVGNDKVIPFFRSTDQAMLANEDEYFPPVLDNTQSQSSLRDGQVLSQDRYGSTSQVTLSTGPYDLPGLPVGRVVETAAEASAYLNTYAPLFNAAATSGQVPTPTSGFVAGYDFMASSAVAIGADLSSSLGTGSSVDSLISPINQAPALGWTASQFESVFLGSRHDISYIGAHFATGSALAADFSTIIPAAAVDSSSVNFNYALVISAGCHSGYNTVDADAISLLTQQPDWAQAFSRKGALLVAGTGYQYGDTDFIAYTDLLALDLAQALHTGNGPISIGQALVQAKLKFLANTPAFRGIHEKTLLEFVLYGLPMVKFNLAGNRLSPPSQAIAVTNTAAVSAGPGVGTGLVTGQLSFDPALTRVDNTLSVVGSNTPVVATYFSGPDGVVTIPGEPVRPLEMFNVSEPTLGFLRGTGFRSAAYHDLTGIVPFTGAPATEIRGVHGSFSTPVFYPVEPWSVNQIAVLTNPNGMSEFDAFPTQFLSDSPTAITGTLRVYDQMDFTLYYCPTVSVAALANPPAVNVVTSTVSGETVTITASVAASTTAGVQNVWITYTGLPGSPYDGTWQSLDLMGPGGGGIGNWTGTLTLQAGADPSLIRYFVQAVNGFGAVTQDTNFGSYFSVGTSTLASVPLSSGGTANSNLVATALTLGSSIPSSATYMTQLPVTATLATTGGTPLVGKALTFSVGSLSVPAVTGAGGVATALLPLDAPPGAYTLGVSFGGDGTYQNSAATQAFTIGKVPTVAKFIFRGAPTPIPDFVAEFVAVDGTPLIERSVIFILTQGTTQIVDSEITDGSGVAHLTNAAIVPGTYVVTAYFGSVVHLPGGAVATLTDPLYAPCTAAIPVTLTAGP